MNRAITFTLVVLAVLCTCAHAITRQERDALLQLNERTQASMCQVKSDSGAIQQWNCPFDNPVCCSFSAKACCPQGYVCDESAIPVKCRKASAATVGNSGAQTISVFPKIVINTPSTPAPGSSGASETSTLTTPVSESSHSMPVGMESSSSPAASSMSSMGSMGSSVEQPTGPVPPFRQNIIIVKNINVLTKSQQPAPPVPKELSELSEESSHEASAHAHESSERSERSEASEESSAKK